MYLIYKTLLAIPSGILYRLGGWGGEGRIAYPKLPGWLFNTKARDIGCGLVRIATIFLIYHPHGVWWKLLIVSLATVVLSLGALSTYWDKLFGYDNYWFHGFVIGLAWFPFCFLTGTWIMLLVKSLVLAIGMGLWSLYNPPVGPWGEDETEEFGRGVLIQLCQ